MASFSAKIKARALLRVLKTCNAVRRISSVNKNTTDNNNYQSEIFNHPYKRCMSEEEVVTHIVDNIIYKSDDLIVTSKPYGIGVAKKEASLVSYKPQTFEKVYIKDILPEVAARLGYKSLSVTRVPDRFASGIMILSINEKGHDQVMQSLKRARNYRMEFQTYITVTVGNIAMKQVEEKFGITEGKRGPGEILMRFSQRMVKEASLKVVKWKHKVLSESKFATLLQIFPSNTHRNSIKLFLATQHLSPVLGDMVFSTQVTEVCQVPLLTKSSTIYNLNPELLSALELQENESSIIPCHVHSQSLTLQLNGKDFTTFSLPLPEVFSWSCKKLNLNVPSDLKPKVEVADTFYYKL